MREEVQKHIVSITVYKTGKGFVKARRFGLFEGKDPFACFDYRGDPCLNGLVKEVVLTTDRLKKRTG